MTARRLIVPVVVATAAVAALLVVYGGREAPRPAPEAGPEPSTAPFVTTMVETTAPPSTTTLAPAPLPVATRPQPPPAAPEPGMGSGFEGRGLVTVAAGGAEVARAPGGREIARVREGVVMGARQQVEGWIQVVTPCDEEAWVRSSQVWAEPVAAPLIPGTGADFADAVLVIDPGHGGPSNLGARSPDGSIVEKDLNLDIAHRVRDLLARPHRVDWDTGAIYAGNEVPAAGAVIVTRSGAGIDADYEAGLIFRAALADAAGAHALVSIHNNAGADSESESAASDVYYQSGVAASRRLAAILVSEFQRSFAGFDADWVATLPVGAKSRLSPRDGTTQYYGILRRAQTPAVIAEGAYLANQSEADLLATPAFRQAYADAVYRALVRFITSDDDGGPSFDPVVWEGHAGSGDARPECVLPEQPATDDAGQRS